jgi:hypothetical protein
MSDESGGFIACADDDADGVLLGLFLFGWYIEGEPSEKPTIVKYLYQGDQTKNDK